jgi:hypothetical protein
VQGLTYLTFPSFSSFRAKSASNARATAFSLTFLTPQAISPLLGPCIGDFDLFLGLRSHTVPRSASCSASSFSQPVPSPPQVQP